MIYDINMFNIISSCLEQALFWPLVEERFETFNFTILLAFFEYVGSKLFKAAVVDR